MAKHIIDGKGKASKGLRSSCEKLIKRGDKVLGGSTNNAMREAFLSTTFPDRIRFSRMGNAIIKAVQVPPKRSHDEQRGWSANLSFRTYNALKEQGIMA